MPDHFISLNCANCGAKLEVYDDMDRFACGYCGTEMLVQRRGGTVALRAVTDAIKKVQAGTDKTAAELALVRLDKELEQLKADYSEVQARYGGDSMQLGCAGVVIGIVVLILAFLASEYPALVACVVIVCIGVAVLLVREHLDNKRKEGQTLAEAKMRIDQKEQEIDRARKTVQG